MRLDKVQEQFKTMMLQSLGALEQDDNDVQSVFIDDHIAVKERLKVYHNNIVGGLSDALRATFPLIEELVGEAFFKGMARAFVFAHPPTSGYLHVYGAGFDDFIATYAPAASLPYLCDVARLELAMNTAYYAADDTPMARDALSDMKEEALPALKLCLRSSVVLLTSDYPLAEIRAFCLDQDKLSAPDVTQGTARHLLVFRPKFDVLLMPLEVDEHHILSCLHRGNALGEAVEDTLAHFSAFDFSAFLKKHIELETFCAPHTND